MPFSPILGPEIPPFAPSDAPPPGRVWPFFNWALLGAWRGILWAIFWSVLVGSFEAISATMLGMLIDGLGQSEPALMWRDVGLIFSVFAFYYLIARPVVFGLNTAAASIRLEPNLFPLILSRLHRYTIGQAVTFFDNDFAGRIAQKQMQTARAATDVVTSLIETAAFSLSSVVGSVLLMATIDGRIAVLLLIWIAGYLLFIRNSLKRIRGASAARGGSMTTASKPLNSSGSSGRRKRSRAATVTFFSPSMARAPFSSAAIIGASLSTA